MRNLSLWKSSRTSLLGSSSLDSEPRSGLGNRSISAVAIDPDQNCVYVTSELCEDDGAVEIELWRVNREGKAELSTPKCAATYSVPPPSLSNRRAGSTRTSEVVSLRLLPDTNSLALVTCAGDFVTFALDEDIIEPEVVGSVESGICSATWSPDDSLLVLLTGDDKLILMTSSFDVLCETPLHTTEFGENAPTALGWGAKHTQFHGSLGKSAAQVALDLASVGLSPDDDMRPRISWRGDGAFFVVSAVSPSSTSPPETTRPRRTIRIYSRDGTLSSTAEPIAGLEHTLSWRPSGNLIASTQRFGSLDGLGQGREGRHDLVFFERNGLRHGQFELRSGKDGQEKDSQMTRRWGYRVREVSWSAGSNVLSVWIEGDKGDVVQLWTTGNYHWYLKQEISAPRALSGDPGRFTTVTWHPEDALGIIITTPSDIIQRTYAWETCCSRSKPPHDSGSVAVFDGANILLTPFRTQNVPPPMSSYTLSVSLASGAEPSSHFSPTSTPVHASFALTQDIFVVLLESGYVKLFNLNTRIGPGRGKVMDPVEIWCGSAISEKTHRGTLEPRQVVILNASEDRVFQVAVLSTASDTTGSDFISVVTIKAQEVLEYFDIPMPAPNGRLASADESLVWQAPDGGLHTVQVASRSILSQASFPEFCFSATALTIPVLDKESGQKTTEDTQTSLYCGLSQSGKLFAVTENGQSLTLGNNVTSFTVASGHLIFTTTAHVAHFAPISTLIPVAQLSSPESSLPEWETRRIERGSRIVTAIPSTMSLVLQMPRGNLETINPRPLVMEIVKEDIDSGNYGKAFLACRKHRIDLNILVEHDHVAFKERLPSFVEQIDNVDYINLFLTSLGQGALSSEVVTDLCDGIRVELEKRDLKKYISSILTAHVVKRPPDHEAGLALLLRLRDSEPQLVEDAVKYIIFLVDADSLFDTALGMYDFSLVLMIAQHAQKDPREYLPFLRELRALDHWYQRFRIDDHLKRYSKALQNLRHAGPERFEEAMLYVEKHQLYEDALSIWRQTENYESVLNIYGEWLFERRKFKEAAFVFRQAKRPSKAIIAHEKALEWQELFELALQENMSAEDLVATAYRVAEDLCSKKRHLDAARVLLDYSQDIPEAVKALVEGSHFSEARRLIALNSRSDLLSDIVYPGCLECRAQISEDLNEMRDQLRKQLQRVRELRVRKVEEPDAFYGVEDVDLHNVDVMTDVSMAPTAFTRYTQAPSSVSRTTSKRSSRSKRKLERKVGSEKKGTVDEEEYLLKSVTKLIGRFNSTQTDAANLLPHLFQFTEEHRTEGQALQEELSAFETELHAAIQEIWTKPPTVEGEVSSSDGWAARMQEYEKQRQIDPLEKVPKPELPSGQWNVKFL